jgi:hypothetical protein
MVDVGGGIGSLKVAKAYPHLRMVIRDRPMVIAFGEGVSSTVLQIITVLRCSPCHRQLLKAELPDAITSGRLMFQGRTPDVLL